MQLHDLDAIADLDAVVRLQREVWGEDDVVPRTLLAIAAKTGGILVGALDDAGGLAGFVFSLPAVRHGRLMQWSHLLAVAPASRGQALGARLKLAQRERALARGLDLVEWTYDPLLTQNAHLNVRRLGAVAETYLENVYGASPGARRDALPTDRLVASWHIDSPHVRRRVEAGPLVARDARVGEAARVLETRPSGPFRRPDGEPDLARDDDRLRVEIPAGFARMQDEAPDLAGEWRLATRRVFQTYFARGYRVVDADAGPGLERPSYLLARRP